jgi:hypothetical protein
MTASLLPFIPAITSSILVFEKSNFSLRNVELTEGLCKPILRNDINTFPLFELCSCL